jgi:hypothetical protein
LFYDSSGKRRRKRVSPFYWRKEEDFSLYSSNKKREENSSIYSKKKEKEEKSFPFHVKLSSNEAKVSLVRRKDEKNDVSHFYVGFPPHFGYTKKPSLPPIFAVFPPIFFLKNNVFFVRNTFF